MSDNPLSGISIPSIEQIVDAVMEAVPKTHIDLGNVIMRDRLRRTLISQLDLAIQFELQRAIRAVTDKAVDHVFRSMVDADYQAKKKKRQEQRLAARKKREELQDEIKSAVQRVDEAKNRLIVVKRPPVTVQ